MQRRQFLRLGSGLALGGALAACGGDGAAPAQESPASLSGTVVGWNRVALQAIRDARPGPPMAARSLAIVHTSMYNAWTAYDQAARPTPHGAPARRPLAEHTGLNKAAAMSHAAHAALADQFPAQKAAFDAHLATLGLAVAPPGAAPTAAEAVGRSAAEGMLAYCHADGANQLGDLGGSGAPYADYSGYQAANPPMVVTAATPLTGIPAPGRWQPLTYTDAAGVPRTPGYLAACWDRVIPFALASASQFRPGPPAAPGTPEYDAQARRIVEVQIALTEREKVIAEYWADAPSSELPPGHWCLFAEYVSQRDRHDDDRDVRMYFALANALADAAIAAWDAKRAYDSERPITAVRFLFSGATITGYGPEGPAGGLRPIAGEAWTPYQPTSFPTPPFPEHVSGHSTFSAAAAEVLARFTGSDSFGASYTKAARSMTLEPALPGSDLTLHWPTFSAAADEAGISRVYGGNHFDAANDAGLALGRSVGALVFEQARAYWEGR